jgi:hypothetical protein
VDLASSAAIEKHGKSSGLCFLPMLRDQRSYATSPLRFLFSQFIKPFHSSSISAACTF